MNVKAAILCLSLFATCLVGPAGCHGGAGDSSMPNTSGMSKDDLLSKGKAMMAKGQMVKDQAVQMKDGDSSDGLSKDDLMSRGDEMMKNGKAMMDMGMQK